MNDIEQLSGIHNPIPQHFSAYSGHCPKCQSTAVATNGEINVPPFAVQVHDMQLGITRTWGAMRCFCSNCSYMFDVVMQKE